MTLLSSAVGGCPRGGASLILGLLLIAGASVARLEAQSSSARGTVDLTLEEYIQRVVTHNESVQERLLELEINRRKFKSEYGVFEPELVASFSRERNKRENTLEQQQTTPTTSGVFSEINNIYQGGLQSLVPTGAKVQLGYTLRDLRNNLKPNPFFGGIPITNSQYQTFFGFSVSQPLLKNAWFPATLAGIRLAALGSDIAFQDYRRQLMIIVSTAEASYWNLYLAQEQVRFFQESVATADKVLNDSRARLETGKGAELEVLEAQAGLALRRSKLSEAEEKLYEAANRVITLYSETVMGTNRLVRAIDQPHLVNRPVSFLEVWKGAHDANPDYLMQRQKVVQEYVRVGYAVNQRFPELNLKGSYGLNGLGDSPGDSWEDVGRGDFPSWSLGVELHIPLGGGIKTANELAAARLRRKEALLGLKETENQIANALDTAVHKISSARESVESYQTVVDFNQSLLHSALERLDVGKIETRKIFDIESDLFEARNSQLESLVNYERALIELDLLQGSLLQRRNLELSQRELQKRTAQLVRHDKLNDAGYETFIHQVQADYENKIPRPVPADTVEQRKAREQLERWSGEWDQTNSVPVPPVIDDPLHQSLRKKLNEVKP